MTHGRCRLVAAASAVVLSLTVGSHPALAVDAPKWVAAIWVDAQKSVGLRWMPAAGATGYKVLRSEKKGADYKEVASVATPTYFDKAVEPGSSYYYVLQAVAGADVSPNSEEKSVTIPGEKKKEVLPPTWSKVSSQGTTEFGKTSYKVGLFWNPNKDAIAYNLYRSTEAGKNYQLLTSLPENQYIDAAVEEGKTYYYVLTALDGSFQETKYSEEKSVLIEAVKKEAKRKKRIKLEVVPRKAKLLWKVTKGDQQGKFAMWEAPDIALDEPRGLVWAVSNNTRELYALKMTNGEVVRVIACEGGKGDGQAGDILGLDIAPNGDIYLVDNGNGKILVFATDGKWIRDIKLIPPPEIKLPEGKTVSPMDVVVDKKSGDIYVTDRTFNQVWHFDKNGEFVNLLGKMGTKAGEMMVPFYIRINKAGNLVVINANQCRVDVYDIKTGDPLVTMGDRGAAVAMFTFISGFDFDAEGNMLVADKAANLLQGFTPDGKYLYHLSRDQGEGSVPVFSVKGVAVDSKNVVYVCEGLVDRVQAFQIIDPAPPLQKAYTEED